MKTVGIIGGSGFIGSYITKKFLDETYFSSALIEENYKVRVSATDLSKNEKYQHLFGFRKARNLEIIPLDVRDADNLRDFMNGCDILVHCGTPYRFSAQDAQREIFEPTVNGTENILNLIREMPGLSKVVFVGSVAAYNTNFPFPADHHASGHVYTEKDLPFFSARSNPYARAKYIADQLVRKYIRENELQGTEIITVAPALVAGRAIAERTDSTAASLQFMIKNRIAPDPFIEMLFDENVQIPVVDVVDVAESIYKAAVIPGLHGKHYLLSGESYTISDVSRLLNFKAPLALPTRTVSGEHAEQELGVTFGPASVPLAAFAEFFQMDSAV